MGKKEKLYSDEQALQQLNSNLEVSDDQYLNYLNKGLAPTMKDTETLKKEIEDAERQSMQADADFTAKIDAIPNINKEEKEYLIEKNRTKELQGPLMDEAIRVMSGNHERQRKVVQRDELGNELITDIKTPDEIAKEPNPIKRKMLTDRFSALTSGGNYYMKDYGNGIKVPVPLMVNEKPEAKHVAEVESVWGTQKEAEDDMWITDIAKRAFNLIPSAMQGIISTVETGLALATKPAVPTSAGPSAISDIETSFGAAKKGLEKFKFKGAEQYKETVIDPSKIEDYKDIFSSKIYDFSPAKILNTTVTIAESLGELALTRGALKAGSITGQAATFGAGYISSVDDALKSAENAGVNGQSKYVVASIVAPIQAGLETKFGIEGKIFDNATKAARKEMISKVIKDNVETVGGKLTKESVEKLYKETIKQETSFLAKYAKNTLEEATTEVLQSMTQNAAENIHDYLLKDDPNAVKYGTKWFSPKAIGDYISSAVVGGFGGFAGSPLVKNQQSQSAYDAVRDGKEADLKGDLASALNRGKLTQDDYDRAVFKINSYKEYYEATKDRPVNDEEKRKIFDLTYEKENLKTGLENIKQNNPGGINDGLIAAKEQELRDYNQQINDIWTSAEARTSTSPVDEGKVEIPQWQTDLDTFSKDIGNADKQVSQNLVSRDNIQTSIGVTPELNELSKPFSIDFKAPHLPEDAGNIQIRNGVLYEPYLIKQKGKEDIVETRELPVYAMEDKDGGTWLFAVGEKTDLDTPDVSYLIKLNEEGNYEGHKEFKYETAKKNELTFDDIVPAFNKLGIKTSSISDEIKGLGIVPEAEFEQVEEIEEFPESVTPVESELFKKTYETVSAGINKAKLKILPNKTVGVTINGVDVPFASQRFLNIEDLPSGDVEVNVRPVENVEGKFGRGLLVETQDGTPLGYLRRAGAVAEKGRVSVENVLPNEDVDIEVPVELSEAAKEKLKQIEKDQSNYELVEDELGRRYINKKTGESYTSVSTFVSGKSGGDFKGDKRLKRTAFEIGNIINGIVKDFFNGTIKAYSNYADNISRDDYNDIVNQLEDVRKYARDNGYSIVTKPLIITDDVNKIAGQPNVIMTDEDGNFYVYDVATLRNTRGLETKELINKKYEGRMSNAERISAQVNILADILNNKYGLDVKRVGVIPFDVDYDVAKKETDPVKISQVTRTKRIDFKRKQILKPTGKTSAEQVKEITKETKKEQKYEPQQVVKEEGVGKPSEEIQKVEAGKPKKRRRIGVPKSKRKIRDKRILSIIDKTPANPFEEVMQAFMRGAKLNTSVFQELYGVNKDLKEGQKITKKALSEARARIDLWNNKTGVSIREFANNLWNNSEFQDQYNTTDYANAIEQVVNSYNSISSMIDYFENTYKEEEAIQAKSEEDLAINYFIQEYGIHPDELNDYWDSLTPEQQEILANESIIPDDFENYIEEELEGRERVEEEPTKKEIKEKGKDIIREEGEEEYPFQKAKSVKSIFDEAVKLFYKIRGTEGAAKKRNLTQERKDLLKENPSVKFIDNNISSIFEQLEKKGIIKRKGDCP